MYNWREHRILHRLPIDLRGPKRPSPTQKPGFTPADIIFDGKKSNFWIFDINLNTCDMVYIYFSKL